MTGTRGPSGPVTTVLVANRGEIARRVFATCRRRGLGTVAVHSDADADAPFVAEADAAVRLPGEAPAETYLRPELIIDAARRAGADAVHPGYGFLSENAAFAREVIEAGLTWIGPPPAAIEQMGSKVAAKAIMADAGVPVLERLEPSAITAEHLPVLIKASAGGGGRGMRVVRRLADLDAELAHAAREAESAFGDPTVFCERYLETGHHIEVQVMADVHGTVLALGERECSIQRRHQKVVEEAPAPLVERIGPAMRERLFDASRAAAGAIGYTGAGTVEFLADDDGGFYFLEMNTRLQVEHPVTELTTGLDLVSMQIDAAEGLALDGAGPGAAGHAIEVRLYAEDPARDWRPQSGTVQAFSIPGVTARFALTGAERGVRSDAGITGGSVVSVHYDPMLAKVIAWAPTRREAARLLAGALAGARIHGLTTNRDLLVRVLRHPAFLDGRTDTAFFDRHGLDSLSAPLCSEDDRRISALAAAVAAAEANRASARVLAGLPSGWRNVFSQPQVKTFRFGEETHEVRYRFARGDGGAPRLETGHVDDVELVSAEPGEVVLSRAGVRRAFRVARYGETVEVDSVLGPCRFEAVPRFVDPTRIQSPGSLVAPMPGTVIRLGAAVGETVTAGRPILWLEAMKMEHAVLAPADGVLTALHVEQGRQVETGAVLAVVADPAADADDPTATAPPPTHREGRHELHRDRRAEGAARIRGRARIALFLPRLRPAPCAPR